MNDTETPEKAAWDSDLKMARTLLERKNLTEIEKDWLLDVIDGCSHDERRQLRTGIELTPRNLWYDYKLQQWIKD